MTNLLISRTTGLVRLSMSLLLLALFLPSCTPAPVDITGAHWDGKAAVEANDGVKWPNWHNSLCYGVQLGQHGLFDQERWESLGVLWDDSGLYFLVFAFDFRPIEIVQVALVKNPRDAVIDAAPAVRYMTLGEVGVWRLKQDAVGVDAVPKDQFRYRDHGWVMKPGQCETEIWIPWKAMGFPVPPQAPLDRLRILVDDKVLTIDIPSPHRP